MCARAEQKLSRRGERERDVCACAELYTVYGAEQKLSREREREMCVRVLNFIQSMVLNRN